MISGAYPAASSKDAEAGRALLLDSFGSASVVARHRCAIFTLPAAEAEIHLAGEDATNSIACAAV
jgi:hypothetical protein